MKDSYTGGPGRRPGPPERTGIRYGGGVEFALILILIAIVVTAMMAAMGANLSAALQEIAAKLG